MRRELAMVGGSGTGSRVTVVGNEVFVATRGSECVVWAYSIPFSAARVVESDVCVRAMVAMPTKAYFTDFDHSLWVYSSVTTHANLISSPQSVRARAITRNGRLDLWFVDADAGGLFVLHEDGATEALSVVAKTGDVDTVSAGTESGWETETLGMVMAEEDGTVLAAVCGWSEVEDVGEEVVCAEVGSGESWVVDVWTGETGSRPRWFAGSRALQWVFFSATQNDTGTELFAVDLTTRAAHLVADLDPGSSSSSPSNLMVLDDDDSDAVLGPRIFFSATTPADGRELFVAAPIFHPGRAFLVRDIYPGTHSSSPTRFLPFPSLSSLYLFSAAHPTLGVQVWVHNASRTTVPYIPPPATAWGEFAVLDDSAAVGESSGDPSLIHYPFAILRDMQDESQSHRRLRNVRDGEWSSAGGVESFVPLPALDRAAYVRLGRLWVTGVGVVYDGGGHALLHVLPGPEEEEVVVVRSDDSVAVVRLLGSAGGVSVVECGASCPKGSDVILESAFRLRTNSTSLLLFSSSNSSIFALSSSTSNTSASSAHVRRIELANGFGEVVSWDVERGDGVACGRTTAHVVCVDAAEGGSGEEVWGVEGEEVRGDVQVVGERGVAWLGRNETWRLHVRPRSMNASDVDVELADEGEYMLAGNGTTLIVSTPHVLWAVNATDGSLRVLVNLTEPASTPPVQRRPTSIEALLGFSAPLRSALLLRATHPLFGSELWAYWPDENILNN
jgi:ELWxxDGT repeat protein